MASGDRIVYRGRPSGDMAMSGNTESARSIQESFYEGLVVDVIVDHMHPEYAPKDGYNVSSIKVRIFSVSHGVDEELLPWADPIDFEVQQLPLIGELVILNKIRGNFFYTRRVPLAHRVTENGMLKLNDALNKRSVNTLAKAVASGEELSVEKHQFGRYFKPDSRIRPLKHFEGDVIFQGRMGHSIRFGSSQIDPSSKGMAPNIILRTGQGKDLEKTDATKQSPFGLILEEVNKDASSIWMVSDQVVPFEPITIKTGAFCRSIQNAPQKFDKASITVNSDRIVLDSKLTHIMLFANEEIYLNSFKNTSIDTDSNIILTAFIDIIQKATGNIEDVADKDHIINAGNDILSVSIKKTSFLADKIYVGSVDNEDEPLVGGTSLAIFLARLIETLIGLPPGIGTQTQKNSRIAMIGKGTPKIAATAHVITPMGPALLNPVIVSALAKLYLELAMGTFKEAPFNSEDNYIMLQNEEPKIELNEFEQGEQVKTENNTWILADPYYKVT